jgi:hypothetical protein
MLQTKKGFLPCVLLVFGETLGGQVLKALEALGFGGNAEGAVRFPAARGDRKWACRRNHSWKSKKNFFSCPVRIAIFGDFCQLSAKKLPFFSKTNVMIKFLHNLALL